jgi:single stranded DNA-binding protein
MGIALMKDCMKPRSKSNMANLLKAQAIGRLTRDPHSGDDKDNGGVYTLLSIAVNRKSGRDEETEYVDVSVRGKQAEACANELSSGDEIFVEGNAFLREFERKDKTIDKVMKINAITVQFINVKKWANGNGGDNGNGRANGRHEDNDDAPRGRGNAYGNGRSNGSRTNGASNGRSSAARY